MEGSASTVSAAGKKASLWMWIAGSAVVLVLIGAAAFFFWPREQSPASVLPAARTQFVLQAATAERLEPYRALFPVLVSAPFGTEASTLAVIENASGNSVWVLFEPRKNRAEALIDGDTALGPWTIVSSEAVSLSTDASLQELPTFANGVRLAGNHTWAYMDAGTMLKEAALPVDQTLRDFLQKNPLLLTWKGNEGETRIAFVQGTTSISPAPVPLLIREEGTFGISLSNPEKSIATFLEAFPKEEQVLMEGLFRGWISKWLSKEVGINSEVLPLLSGPLSVSAKLGTGSVLHIAVAANTSNEANRKQMAERIAQGFRSMLAHGTVQNFTFEDRFNTSILFPGGAANETTETVQGTTVRMLQTSQNRTLALAERGSILVLGNDAGLVKNFLSLPEPGESLPTLEATPETLARGWVPTQYLSQFFTNILGMPAQSVVLGDSLNGNGTILWRMEKLNGIPVLSVVFE